MPLSLIEFRITNVGLTSLPALYQHFGNNTPAPLSIKSFLRVVEIESCHNLISLDGFLEQGNLDLQAIEKLTIKDCKRLVHLPTHGFGKLTSLINLTLRDSPKLVAMDFQGYLLLTKLQQLSMGNCGELDLPLLESSSGITTLTQLELQSANITSFAAAQNSFRSLKWLGIWGCTMLMEFSFHEESHGTNQENNFNDLNVTIVNCPNLIKFPTYLPLSQPIFSIRNVGLSALPEYYQSSDSSGVPTTSSLINVQITNCQNIKALNGFLQQDHKDFQSIKEIKVSNCNNLVHLPMGAFGKFVSLQRLIISGCPMLTAIDNHSTLLPMALKYLTIRNCGKVDEPLLESASSLPKLTDLEINHCANISHIPYSENAFGSLNVLSIRGCKKLLEHSSREQARGANQGSSLASLKLKKLSIDMPSLLLIEPLRSLRFVSSLDVDNCSGMEVLLEQWLLQNTNTLTVLDLRDARTLNSLPSIMARLTVLEDLKIRNANLLEELPELPASLRSLELWKARSLKSLPTTMARLTVLEKLLIRNADLLEELPELPASLKKKTIEGRGGRWL